ncbi:GAF and ANTAR domain-containing protein [Spirillospora sp. NPDC047279]|uniref:GAF and ANTAR domain-containing protein n=1 Tax=Spirillospora sp. NPDC047279 TaxID=3155478 RepID=UPI0033F2B83E
MLERRTAETFVELVDTLVVGFDVIDLLHILTERCVELLGIDAVGILLADQRGALSLVAASTEQARLLELFQLQSEEGPCLDAYHGGHPVSCADLAAQPQRWPAFTAAAGRGGFAAVHALPMRLRDQRLGAMNLFAAAPGGLSAETTAIAQALADVATIGILHERALRQSSVVTEQLQGALNSRVVIEQAKGVLAEIHGIEMAEAFTLMRDFARARNRKLTEVAAAVIDRGPDGVELRSRRASADADPE